MKSPILVPQRYQLKKEAMQVLLQGHPWIFRSHLSSAAGVFRSGQWLKLVDHTNKVLGYGVYDDEGLIGIRIFKRGATPLEGHSFEKMLNKALDRRQNVRKYSDAFRALHGENDAFPGVVVDVYGSTGVLQTYSSTVDGLGRYVAGLLFQKLSLKNLIWKLPSKRQGKKGEVGTRVLRGHLPKRVAIHEGKLGLQIEIGEGQKSGAFLDLRALRKWVASQDLKGKRVLNLFSYTGTLGLAAEVAGATEIWNVDISAGALDFAKQYQTLNPARHRFIKADIFDWLKTVAPKEKFDLIIIDPPPKWRAKSLRWLKH